MGKVKKRKVMMKKSLTVSNYMVLFNENLILRRDA